MDTDTLYKIAHEWNETALGMSNGDLLRVLKFLDTMRPVPLFGWTLQTPVRGGGVRRPVPQPEEAVKA